MPAPLSLDEILTLLHKTRRELDMTARRLDVVIADLVTHAAKQSGPSTKKRATKRKPRSGT